MNEQILVIDLVCPHCKKPLRLGLDVEVGCHVWCPLCQENLEFVGNGFGLVSLKSKAYGWLRGAPFWRVG